MSDEGDNSPVNDSNDELTTYATMTPNALSPTGSKNALHAELDLNRSLALVPKSPIKKKSLPAGRRLQDIDPNLSGSIDFSGDSKPKILHHRVDDLSALEESYEIGKKLGQ